MEQATRALAQGREIGVTGTRTDITAFQRENLMFILSVIPSAVHYGDCSGADYEAFQLCKGLGLWTVCHPPDQPFYRMFTKADETRGEKGFLARDLDIVTESKLLVVVPRQNVQPVSNKGSGTWTTHGYARQQHKTRIILWPDNRVEVRDYPW